MTSLYKASCPECGSSDARQVFLNDKEQEDSYCFACLTYFPPENKQEKEQIEYEAKPMKIEDIKEMPIMAIPDRKIRKETCEKYGVHVGLSETDGQTITHHYYPDTYKGKLVGYEIREVETKKFRSVGDRKGELDLWGQSTCKGGKKLFITEGRLDAMSLYQAIVDNTPEKYKKYPPSVVSITRGVSHAVKDMLNNRDFIDNYQEVVLCFDQDSAGHKSVKDVLKVFPTFKVAKFELKDASDMYMAGKGRELYQQAVWDSGVERQGEVVDVEDFIENAMEKPKMGLSFPWPTVTKACFGIRPHTIHVVAAAPKLG